MREVRPRAPVRIFCGGGECSARAVRLLLAHAGEPEVGRVHSHPLDDPVRGQEGAEDLARLVSAEGGAASQREGLTARMSTARMRSHSKSTTASRRVHSISCSASPVTNWAITPSSPLSFSSSSSAGREGEPARRRAAVERTRLTRSWRERRSRAGRGGGPRAELPRPPPPPPPPPRPHPPPPVAAPLPPTPGRRVSDQAQAVQRGGRRRLPAGRACCGSSSATW